MDGKRVGPVELIERAKGKINDILFVCEHSLDNLPGMIEKAKKYLDQAVGLIKSAEEN